MGLDWCSAVWFSVVDTGQEINEFKLTSTGPYRSCAALLDISNPLKYLVGFSLVWLVLVWLHNLKSVQIEMFRDSAGQEAKV